MRVKANLGPKDHPNLQVVTVLYLSDTPGFYTCLGSEGEILLLHAHQLDMSKNKIEPIYKKIGDRIADLRIEKEKYQREIAASLGMTRSNYAQIEQGRLRLALHQIPALAEALGCNPVNLFKEFITTEKE